MQVRFGGSYVKEYALRRGEGIGEALQRISGVERVYCKQRIWDDDGAEWERFIIDAPERIYVDVRA